MSGNPETDSNTIVAIDLFCGAGGFSEALRQVAEEQGQDLREAAVNHWQTAIDSHEANHPHAKQYHSKIEQLHPPDIVEDLVGDPSHRVDILTGGPSCVHFSNARGGKPVNEQKRSSPWDVLTYLSQLNVRRFIIENVPEIERWGPVNDGKPSRDGSVFDAWINAINSLGYSVKWQTLNAADFGDPTSRKRFFLIGTKDGEATFPEPTHDDSDAGKPDRRTAAEVIDWSDLGGSIWTRDLDDGRKTPPKNSTMRRIAEGIRRHCDGPAVQFADVLEQIGRDEIRALRNERVIPAGYASQAAAALDAPFLVEVPDTTPETSILLRQQDGAHPINVEDRCVPTIMTRGSHAISSVGACSLIQPKNGLYGGLHSNSHYEPSDKPFHTVTSDPRAALLTPSLIRYSHGGATLDVEDPMSTIASERGGVFATSSPYLTPLYNGRANQDPRQRSVTRPLMTVPASKSPAALTAPVLQPFIDDCQGPAQSPTSPLKTQPASDRYALCTPALYPYGIDVKYRMLQPEELKQAQGFPESYTLTGTKTDRTRQIGNAVPVNLAKSLIEHILISESPSLGSFGGGLSTDSNPEIPDYDQVVSDD